MMKKHQQEELMKELLESHSQRTIDPDDPVLLKNMMVQNSAMNTPKCVLDTKGCLNLSNILESYTAGIKEEQAWALCYQCIKSGQSILNNSAERDLALLVTVTHHVKINRDGHVHKDTYLDDGNEGTNSDGMYYKSILYLK